MSRLVPALAADPVSVSGSNLTWVVIVAVIALLALGVAGVLVREVLAASQGTQKMQEIARAVQEGAAAYLRRQFQTLGIFVIAIFFILLLLPADGTGVRWGRSIFFLVGAVFSAVTGFVGMTLCTRGNVRVAAAAREGGEQPAMRIAFRTGGVAGMFTVGLGLFGAAVVVLSYKANAPSVLEGYGFGAALIALFARVGGGIYTKAADVGADLVGKVEENIPEDDPRNPAVIADNVGDNVGDIAGMGADLFGSVAESTCAALVIGAVAFATNSQALLFPILITAVGVPIALLATFFARTSSERGVESALKRTLIVSSLLMAIAMWYVTMRILPEGFTFYGVQYTALGVYYSFLAGLVAGLLIGIVTEIYTSHRYKPV